MTLLYALRRMFSPPATAQSLKQGVISHVYDVVIMVPLAGTAFRNTGNELELGDKP